MLSFHGLIKFLCGFVAGMLVAICVSPLFKDSKPMDVESDTTRVEVTKSYGKLDLHTKTVKLDLPKIDKSPQMIFVPEEKTTVIVRDSISYIMMDRESFYTETDEAKIWHSGVESRIDSLMVISKKETTTYKAPDFRHSLSFSGSVGYDGVNQYYPVGIEYLYHPKRWIGFGAGMQYDHFTKNVNVYATMKLTIRWK